MEKRESKMNVIAMQQLVFERNEFKCQICHKQVPSVLLVLDKAITTDDNHVDPPEDGYYCLCESCYKKRHDHYQTTPTSRASDRREQLKMLIEWRKDWKGLTSQVHAILIDYINGKIDPFHLTKKGEQDIRKAVKKSDLVSSLDAMDEMFDYYVEYKNGEDLIKDSVDEFLSKIGGYLYIKSLPPVDQEVYHVCNSCRSHFRYWNDQEGKALVWDYVDALRDYGWSEDRILDDLKNELLKQSNRCKNWSEWCNLVEGWTSSVKKWKDQNSGQQSSGLKRGTKTDGDIRVDYSHHCYATFDYLFHLVSPKDEVRRNRIREQVQKALHRFLLDQHSALVEKQTIPQPQNISSLVFERYLPFFGDTLALQEDEPFVGEEDLPFNLEGPYNDVFFSCILGVFQNLYLPTSRFDYPTCVIVSQYFLDHYHEIFWESRPF